MQNQSAATLIKYMGGIDRVSIILRLKKGAVYRFTHSKDKGGCGGFIPAKHQVRLLNYAKEHNIDLRPEDFFYPERLQALLAQKDNSQEAQSPSCGASDLPQDATRAQSTPRMGAGGNQPNYSVHT